jgi:hypothetical protein
MYVLSNQFLMNLSILAGGPAHLRYFIQPVIAIALGLRDGRVDARMATLPYFVAILTARGHRLEILKKGYRAIATPFFVAVILDAIVQWLILETIYPGGAILTGVFLIALPYLLARGLTNRVTTRKSRRLTSVPH